MVAGDVQLNSHETRIVYQWRTASMSRSYYIERKVDQWRTAVMSRLYCFESPVKNCFHVKVILLWKLVENLGHQDDTHKHTRNTRLTASMTSSIITYFQAPLQLKIWRHWNLILTRCNTLKFKEISNHEMQSRILLGIILIFITKICSPCQPNPYFYNKLPKCLPCTRSDGLSSWINIHINKFANIDPEQ